MRVSTKEQNLDRQEDALIEYGVDDSHIFADMISGKNFNRPEYKKMIRILRKGDIVVIKSIDRLGRNYSEIIDQFKIIMNDIGCGIHVIDMPALNTSGDPDDLINQFTKDMTLQVLSFVAQNERETTLKRQREGIEAAKRRNNVKIGRPKKKMPFDFWAIYALWRRKEYPTQTLIKYCHNTWGTSVRSFYRRISELDARYSCIKTERLYDLILDDEWYDGISYDIEHLQQQFGYFTSYNSNKLIKKSKKDDDNIEIDNHTLKKNIIEQRTKDFQDKFNISDPKDLYTETIKTPGEVELPTKLIYKKKKNTTSETVKRIIII